MDEKKSIDDNPYIPNPADYFSGYNDSIKENFGVQQKESLRLQKLTYEVFNSDSGREWLSVVKDDLSKKLCMINITAMNAELLLSEQRGKMLLVEEVLQGIQAYKEFLKSS